MTKEEAVKQMIDGAIRAHEAGEDAIAITLAGAAESAMPEPTGKHLFAVTRDVFTGHADPGGEPLDRKQVVAKLNEQRDWLKHYGPTQPPEMDLRGSITAVFRVMSKFQAVYGYDAETAVMKEFFAAARTFDPHDG